MVWIGGGAPTAGRVAPADKGQPMNRAYDNSVQVKFTAVAVYGSLRQGLGLHHVIERCPFIGKGVLHGADLYSFGAYPGIVLRPESPDKSVVVEVYAVDKTILERLDQIEGFYDRVVVQIRMSDGRIQPALIYSLDDARIRQAPHVSSGDWTTFKRQLDRGEHTHSGPYGYFATSAAAVDDDDSDDDDSDDEDYFTDDDDDDSDDDDDFDDEDEEIQSSEATQIRRIIS